MNFSDFQNILKEKLGIEHLADVARELGVSPQAVSNWKARNKVPYKYVSKLRKQLIIHKDHSDDNNVNNNSNPDKEFRDSRYSYYLKEDNISLADILLIIARQIRISSIPTPLIPVCQVSTIKFQKSLIIFFFLLFFF